MLKIISDKLAAVYGSRCILQIKLSSTLTRGKSFKGYWIKKEVHISSGKYTLWFSDSSKKLLIVAESLEIN